MRYTKVAVFIIGIMAMGLVQNARGQNGRLFVLCEGNSDMQGSLGYIQIPSMQYVHVDSVSRYGNALYQHGDSLYVVVDFGDILVFNLRTNQFVDTINAHARQVAVWNSQLLVTSFSDPFFRVYSISNGFPLLYSLDATKVRDVAEGISVVGNRAFIAVNGYGSDSLVVVIDLVAQDTFRTVSVAKNPNNFAFDGNRLYVQSLTWSPTDGGLIITHLDQDGNVIKVDSTYLVSYGGFALIDNLLYFNNTDLFNPTLAAYSVSSGIVIDSVIAGYFYALYGYGDTLWLSETDFISTGYVRYWDGTTLSAPVATHISPRALLFVPDVVSGIESESLSDRLVVYPNPVEHWLFFSAPVNEVELYTLTGEKVLEGRNQTRIWVGHLPSGCYILKGSVGGKVFSRTVQKR
jgi:hypothetical protein